jgi:hypothetical protein
VSKSLVHPVQPFDSWSRDVHLMVVRYTAGITMQEMRTDCRPMPVSITVDVPIFGNEKRTAHTKKKETLGVLLCSAEVRRKRMARYKTDSVVCIKLGC